MFTSFFGNRAVGALLVACIASHVSAAEPAPTALSTPRLTDAEIKARVCYIDTMAVRRAVALRHKVMYDDDPAYPPFAAATNRAITDEFNRQGCALLIEGTAPAGSKDFTAVVLETVAKSRIFFGPEEFVPGR